MQRRVVAVVPMRVRDGDDGSCLNLSRPQSPRLIGVDPEALAERGAGTGGFALYGQASLPVTEDLDSERGRDVSPA